MLNSFKGTKDVHISAFIQSPFLKHMGLPIELLIGYFINYMYSLKNLILIINFFQLINQILKEITIPQIIVFSILLTTRIRKNQLLSFMKVELLGSITPI